MKCPYLAGVHSRISHLLSSGSCFTDSCSGASGFFCFILNNLPLDVRPSISLVLLINLRAGDNSIGSLMIVSLAAKQLSSVDPARLVLLLGHSVLLRESLACCSLRLDLVRVWKPSSEAECTLLRCVEMEWVEWASVC